ncbi:MAG: C25 family cysteine peptidase [Bacteroidales bacterium]|jgi:hypothetical protein|nr:C25 family cysteine peptidase [Bacteroidales bacterium]MDY0369260.1 C25 family cysteine peptidase [Bacteroidales bacterium]
MKRLVFCLLLLTHITHAQVSHVFEFSQPDVTHIGQFFSLELQGTMNTGLAGTPALPYQMVSLLLPQGQIAASIEIVRDNKITLDGNYLLYPAQASRPLSAQKEYTFQLNEHIYQSTAAFPESVHGQLVTATLHGHQIAMSSFTPVEYIPATGQVSLYKKVTVIIHTRPDPAYPQHLAMVRTDDYASDAIKRIAQNVSQIPSYQSNRSASDTYELLIITPQNFAQAFEPLIEYYFTKGIRTQLITKETVVSQFSGQDVQEKIRNCIIDAYQNHHIENVLLGGDVEHIPYRGFYCYVQSGSGYSDNNIPADLYYAALDGTWDDNGNNIWGEPDEADLLPEIGVGRMPFSNITELNNLLNKTMMYQTQPVLGDFQKPLLVGENLYYSPDTWGRDYLELLIGTHHDNGYTTTGIPESYDIQKMYEYDYYWSKSQLISAINQGVQYVHHVGHASETYVAKMTNSDITNSNFNQTNGISKNFTIFHTHGCDCGAFDYNDCILERMVNIENFAVAAVGNSRYGWFNEGQTEGPAAHLHREMTDAQFNKKIGDIGSALSEAKRQTAPWVTAPGQWEEGALRWNFYDLNILGDPNLSVWTDEPYAVTADYQTEIFVGSPELTVEVWINDSPAPNGYRVSVVKDDIIVANGLTNENGNLILYFDEPVTEAGEANLIVSGFNIFPHTFDLLFIASEGPFVVYESHTIDDSTPNGNGNGIPEYNETVSLGISLENIGVEHAQNVVVILSADDELVSIDNPETELPFIGSGETVLLNEVFIVSFAKETPDQHQVKFQLQCSDGTDNWNSSFNQTISAAILSIGDHLLNDHQGGNGNGRLDPGETVQFEVEIHNTGHSATQALTAEFTSISPYVTLTGEVQEIGVMDSNSTQTISCELQVSSDTPPGMTVTLNMRVYDQVWDEALSLILPIGLQIEDFESGNFDMYEWHHDGDANWMISMFNPYEGNFSAKSGNISHNQKSDLWISLINASEGTISFARKVSSENNYDNLNFYVNELLQAQWSGEQDWEEVSFIVPEGQNILRWSYVKDQSVSYGTDAAWIDHIVFPFNTTMIGIDDHRLLNAVSIMPNPGKGLFYLSGLDSEQLDIQLFDMAGKNVFEYQGYPPSNLNIGHLEDGVYVLQIVQPEKVFRTRLILSR